MKKYKYTFRNSYGKEYQIDVNTSVHQYMAWYPDQFRHGDRTNLPLLLWCVYIVKLTMDDSE
jgi:hypothetical protein